MSSKPRFVGEKQPLENRVDYVRGVTYKAAVDLHEELNDSSYVLLRANNIQDGELRFDDVQYVDRTKVKQKQLLRRGDILFCASSGSKGLVGKAALVRENMPVTFGAFCCVLRPKENEAEYLAHYFQSQQYRRAIEKVCSGSNINNLKAANFFSLVVPHYDDDSTRIISALFDSIDAQIKHAKDQIANLDSLVKSRFVEMFGNICEGMSCFDMTPINDLCTRIVGGGTPSMKHPEYYEDGTIPWLKSGDVKARVVGSGVLDITEAGLANSSARMVPEGSIIVVTRSGILKHSLPVAKAACPIAINQDLKALIPGDRILPDYLQWSLIVASPLLLSKVRATTADNIETSFLKSFKVPVPPVSLQREFVAFVAQVDKSRFVRDHEMNFR